MVNCVTYFELIIRNIEAVRFDLPNAMYLFRNVLLFHQKIIYFIILILLFLEYTLITRLNYPDWTAKKRGNPIQYNYIN